MRKRIILSLFCMAAKRLCGGCRLSAAELADEACEALLRFARLPGARCAGRLGLRARSRASGPAQRGKARRERWRWMIDWRGGQRACRQEVGPGGFGREALRAPAHEGMGVVDAEL